MQGNGTMRPDEREMPAPRWGSTQITVRAGCGPQTVGVPPHSATKIWPRTISSLRLGLIGGALSGWLCFSNLAPAQETTPPATTAAPATAAAPTSTKSFTELLVEWKGLETKLAEKEAEYQALAEVEILKRSEAREAYNALLKSSTEVLDQLRSAATQEVQAKGFDPLVMRTLMGILVNDAANDRDDLVLPIADTLIEKKIDPRYWQTAARLERLKIEAREVFEEILVRQRQHDADNLPQAKIITNRGEILVELYEDEAPNTVANFISLAKSGFYNGLKFHRVIEGFMAQTGSPKGDGTDGPGYTIADECNSPEARQHFTGVLSMANSGAPDSNGSQFFITFSRSFAVKSLDGRHTVFGRVLAGQDVLDRLTRTHQTLGPQEQAIADAVPDTITRVEIVRDRGRVYEPIKSGTETSSAGKEQPAPQPTGETNPPVVDPPVIDPPVQGGGGNPGT